MRKLVYVGKDKFDTIVRTTSYTEKKVWETKGFTFTEVMEEEKPNKPDLERIAKVREALAKKRK